MSLSAKKITQIAALLVFFILILSYAFYRSHDLIYGVKIKNVNISDGETFTDPVLHLTGNAKNAVNLTLNGREITIDQSGNFNETIALLLGYNIVDIKAKDKFGYNDEKIYKLIYEAN